MKTAKHYQDYEWVYQKYHMERLSTYQIAEIAGCSSLTVWRWMVQLEIPRRTLSEAAKIVCDPTTPEGQAQRQARSEVMKAAWKRGNCGDAKWHQAHSKGLRACCDPTTSQGRARRQVLSRAGRALYDPTTPQGQARRQAQSRAMKVLYDSTTLEGQVRRQTQVHIVEEAWKRDVYGNAEWRRALSKAVRDRFDPATLEGQAQRQVQSHTVKALYDPTTPEGQARRRARSHTAKVFYDPTTLEGQARRQALSETTKAAWERGDYDGKFFSPTSIEIAIADSLNALSIAHEGQYRPEGCSFVFDEFIPSCILIEVQGDYWHSRLDNQERDVRKAQWAQDHGYTLITIWEHEIKEHGAEPLIRDRVLPLLH